MTDYPIFGGCHCGAVRFTLHGPPESVAHCHCSICRRLSSSFFQTAALVSPEILTIDRGGDNLTSYESSPGFRREFCRTCGAPLFALEDQEPGRLYFPAASLDEGVHPGHPVDREHHIYVGSKARWEEIGGDIPQHDTFGPDDILTEIEKAQLSESGNE